jgi:hypothetical protein
MYPRIGDGESVASAIYAHFTRGKRSRGLEATIASLFERGLSFEYPRLEVGVIGEPVK